MLKVEGLKKTFFRHTAVDGLDFRVEKGSITALIGPNGAGKTTTFNMVSGFVKPDGGTVFFKGRDIGNKPAHAVARQGCLRTFQGVEVFHGMSVLENVLIGASGVYCHRIIPALLRTAGYRCKERLAFDKAMGALARVGLEKLADHPVSRLGFGQLRLMEISRALAAGPKLLLLDEPGAGLNSREVEDLALLLKGLNAEGLTIFIIDHDMHLIMDIAHTIIVMDRGKRIAAGPPEEVQTDAAVIAAYLGA